VPGAKREERRGQAKQFVSAPHGGAPHIAGRKHHELRGIPELLEVIDGERAVGKCQGGEQRVMRVDMAMRGEMGQFRPVKQGRYCLDRRRLPGQAVTRCRAAIAATSASAPGSPGPAATMACPAERSPRRPACHNAAEGVTVTGRPAHEGRIDQGND